MPWKSHCVAIYGTSASRYTAQVPAGPCLISGVDVGALDFLRQNLCFLERQPLLHMPVHTGSPSEMVQPGSHANWNANCNASEPFESSAPIQDSKSALGCRAQVDTAEHLVQATVAAVGNLPQLPVAMQNYGKPVIAGGVAAEVEAAGHHMYVLLMVVCICVQHVLVSQRERPLGIVEADDLIPILAEGCGPHTLQAQQQHPSIQTKFPIVWQAAAVPCNAADLS